LPFAHQKYLFGFKEAQSDGMNTACRGAFSFGGVLFKTLPFLKNFCTYF
jgi:hypothetical protein